MQRLVRVPVVLRRRDQRHDREAARLDAGDHHQPEPERERADDHRQVVRPAVARPKRQDPRLGGPKRHPRLRRERERGFAPAANCERVVAPHDQEIQVRGPFGKRRRGPALPAAAAKGREERRGKKPSPPHESQGGFFRASR